MQAMVAGGKELFVDELATEMTNIKVMCVITQIYEITKKLQNEIKAKLRQYCDMIMRDGGTVRSILEKKGIKDPVVFNTNIDG